MENNESILLDVESLSKSFENVQAVDNLSFQIRKGEIYGLLGPNGSGKTTTIKLILGLLEADAGNITVLGFNPEVNEVEIKNQIGYVSEEPLIYKSLTPKELFNFIASIRKLDGDKVSKKLAGYLEGYENFEFK